ncbi:uncharacterized protein LOC101221084 [Cucumis sativus]|uniref:DUF7851 domain-containing protein n=1 Tax=Cucumis sativus TaxID=3659 RepID=A0A0A0KQ89_CUCSA|nr:uncharacterized protein LOC101221084 [Cucumis sativus]KGN50542.1 hypothetical protein Csa_021489 [Cucumis sativus]
MEIPVNKSHNKKQKHHHQSAAVTPNPPLSDYSFKPSAAVKGLRFGGQFVVKSFTIRRVWPLEFLQLLSLPPRYDDDDCNKRPPFNSTAAFLPTNFTILAHHAWNTLTLGLGTKKSKAILFVFATEALKAAAGRVWPAEIAFGDVNRRLIRGLSGCEMARFKFRKGCLTFYIYAVREKGCFGFSAADDLKTILQAVVSLNDFLDHTAMLALPNQRNISYSGGGSSFTTAPVGVVH